MYRECIKISIMLAVLLAALASLSTGACPRAMNDLYRGQCGEVLDVAAPGILTNDVKDSGKTLSVMNPDLITINPKYGSIQVESDGSFVYTAALNIASGTYVPFYYKVTDGSCVSQQALVKIQVGCKCHPVAPDITVYDDSEVNEDLLISMGANCIGCPGAAPEFDLSEIEASPGIAYPYTVTCSGCQIATGHVTVRPELLCINGTVKDLCTELPLSGWEITVYDALGDFIAKKTTTADGSYSFCNLEPGDYTVEETPQEGWVAAGFDTFIYVHLEDNDLVDVDFTNAKTYCISGYKLNAEDGSGISGWAITLQNSMGDIVADALTNGNGKYLFCGLSPDDYVVSETMQDGWTSVTPEAAMEDLNCRNVTNINFTNMRV